MAEGGGGGGGGGVPRMSAEAPRSAFRRSAQAHTGRSPVPKTSAKQKVKTGGKSCCAWFPQFFLLVVLIPARVVEWFTIPLRAVWTAREGGLCPLCKVRLNFLLYFTDINISLIRSQLLIHFLKASFRFPCCPFTRRFYFQLRSVRHKVHACWNWVMASGPTH